MWWLFVMLSNANEPVEPKQPVANEPVSAKDYDWSPLQRFLIARASGLKPDAVVMPNNDDPALQLQNTQLTIDQPIGHAQARFRVQCNREEARETYIWQQDVVVQRKTTLTLNTPKRLIEQTHDCDFVWSQVDVVAQDSTQHSRPFLMIPTEHGFRAALDWEQQIVQVQLMTKKHKSYGYLAKLRDTFVAEQGNE